MSVDPQSSQNQRRLLFYTHALVGGGAERVWAQLASAFARAGDEVFFAVDRAADENTHLIDASVKMVTLGGSHARNLLNLARLIQKTKPDAILCALAASDLKGALAASLAGARHRAILSYHGFAASEPKRLSQIAYRATPLLTRICGASVAVSDALRRDLIETWGGDKRKIVRIYNPILAAAPASTPLQSANDDLSSPQILAVGRLVDVKKFDVLIRAFALLDRPDAHLTILGEGPERSALLALAASLGVRERLHMPGWRDDPTPFYLSASCLVVSSESEAFGLVAAEALAHGLPVVSTDCFGPREILGDGRWGELVPIGDAPAMSQAIAHVLRHPGDRAPRIERSLDFSLAHAMQSYSALIDRLSPAGSPR